MIYIRMLFDSDCRVFSFIRLLLPSLLLLLYPFHAALSDVYTPGSNVFENVEILPSPSEPLKEADGFKTWVLNRFAIPGTLDVSKLMQNSTTPFNLSIISNYFRFKEIQRNGSLIVSVNQSHSFNEIQIQPLILQIQVPKVLYKRNIFLKWSSTPKNALSYDSVSKELGIKLFHSSGGDKYITFKSVPLIVRVKSQGGSNQHLIQKTINGTNASILSHSPTSLSARFQANLDRDGLASSTKDHSYWKSIFLVYAPSGIFGDPRSTLAGNYQGNYQMSFVIQ